MKEYKQTDGRWVNNRLGTCGVTIGSHGCFITSLAMLDGRTPQEINNFLRNNNGYVNGCEIDGNLVSKKLGLEYNGVSYNKPDYSCIAETDHYASQGIKQHFFILLTNGRIIDPLNGYKTDNYYNIVRYHLFKEKGEEMTKDQAIGLMKSTLRRTWIELTPGQEPDQSSIDKEAEESVNKYLEKNNADFTEDLITKWAKDGYKASWVPKSQCNEFEKEIEMLKKTIEAGTNSTIENQESYEKRITELEEKNKELSEKIEIFNNKNAIMNQQINKLYELLNE